MSRECGNSFCIRLIPQLWKWNNEPGGHRRGVCSTWIWTCPRWSLFYFWNFKVLNRLLSPQIDLNNLVIQSCFVKYPGVLIDSNPCWKYHVSHVASKISRNIGVNLASLRHFTPFSTLLNIYRSLIFPYLSYGITAWGQAGKTHL